MHADLLDQTLQCSLPASSARPPGCTTVCCCAQIFIQHWLARLLVVNRQHMVDLKTEFIASKVAYKSTQKTLKYTGSYSMFHPYLWLAGYLMLSQGEGVHQKTDVKQSEHDVQWCMNTTRSGVSTGVGSQNMLQCGRMWHAAAKSS